MLSRFMTRREQLVLAFVAAAIMLGSGVMIWLQQDTPSIEQTPAVVSSPSVSSLNPVPAVISQVPEQDMLVVSVQGACCRWGILRA